MRRLIKVAALVALILATLVSLGLISAAHAEALLPLGLTLWCASEV